MDSRVVLAAAALLVTALAGCAQSEDGPIKVVQVPADGRTDPVVLEATVSADSYEWDMGDGRPKLTDQRVEHVYGVQNGAFTVKLTTTSGGQSTQHPPLRIDLGTGSNAAPAYELAVEWQWIQVGENVTLSGAGSSDPDGDALLFSWFCQPQGAIALAGAGHGHPGGGGVPYGSTNANVIPVRMLNGTDVLQTNATVSGDLCTNLPSGYTEEATIRGSFSEPGLYEITMLAKDPTRPAVPGSVLLFVSSGPRQTPLESHPFTGTIDRGAPREMDESLKTAGQAEHLAEHSFRIKYPLVGLQVRLTSDDGAGVPVQIAYAIYKGSTLKIDETSQDTVRDAEAVKTFTPGDYTALVALRQGADVEYDLTVDLYYETDPVKIFEGPH